MLENKRQLSQVIGINVDIGDIATLSKRILNLAKKGLANSYVCVANVHMLTIARADPFFGEVLKNASIVTPDGMPLVWTQKIRGIENAMRVSGPDLMLELCRLASNDELSIYLLGGNSPTLDLLSENLLARFPNLKIAGMYAPEMLSTIPELDISLAESINKSGANILFVGLGCPKQEYWCARYAPYLKATAIGVGAAFDFHAGIKKRPPLLIQKLGLEWLYRLLSEPKRLWKRYLTSNTIFIYYSLLDLIKQK